MLRDEVVVATDDLLSYFLQKSRTVIAHQPSPELVAQWTSNTARNSLRRRVARLELLLATATTRSDRRDLQRQLQRAQALHSAVETARYEQRHEATRRAP